MANKMVSVFHRTSGELLAQGPKGWGMFAFEGNYYIAAKHLKTNGFEFSGIPGICPYKFVYFWYHFKAKDGTKISMLGWKYWLPNPLFPFIAFRLALPKRHSELLIEETTMPIAVQ